MGRSSFFLCPSCGEKRTLLLGEYLAEDLLLRLPHRQFVWTIPKALRGFLKRDRSLFTAMLLFGQHLSSPDILSAVAEHHFSTLLAALALIVMGISCAGIGISLFEELKKHGAGLARAVMGLRIMEGALQISSAVGFFTLVAVSEEFVKAGSPPDSLYQSAGSAIKAVNDWTANIYASPFGIAALIYYAIFYRTRLVPRWLSTWGLAGNLLLLISALASLLGLLDPSSPVLFLLNMPILVQELVLALWLIVKGYNDPEKSKEQVR